MDGREPQQVTEFEYDDQGRLVRAVTTTEPRWTPQDRAEMLALTDYRASICPNGCGQPVTESTSHWRTGPQYDPRSITCRACAAMAEAQSAAEERKVADLPAKIWYITKAPRE